MSSEIKLSNGNLTRLDMDEFLIHSQYKWAQNGDGYAHRFNSNNKWILLHRIILSASAGQLVDHINGDKLDNRKQNLRFCNKMQNAQNMKKPKRGNNKYKGASWNKKQGEWESYIRYEKIKYKLGYYKTEEEAAHAYDAAAKKYFGEFARLNFPEEEAKNENISE